MNQSEFLAITCNLLKARENSRVQGAIGSNLVLALIFVGWKICLPQSLNVAAAIAQLL